MKRVCLAILFTLCLAWVAAAQSPVAAQGPISRPFQEETEVKIFSLMNIPASDAARVVDALFSDRFGQGRVAVDNNSNSVIVNATAERLKIVEAVLKKIDSTPPQQMATVAVYKLAHAESGNVMRLLADVLNHREEFDPLRLAADEKQNSILVYGTAEAHEEILKLLKTIDVPSGEQEEKKQVARSIRFQLFWIGEGDGEGSRAVPTEIAQVLDKQKQQIGITKPALLASASTACYVVPAAREGANRVYFRNVRGADGSELDCLAIVGMSDNDSFILKIELSAGTQTKTEIESSVLTKLDHLVFLTSTIAAGESNKPTVFVLKLSEVEDAK